MASPPPPLGLWHVALQVRDLPACEAFYTGLLGLRVEWRPDPDNVYLSSGRDNLALHRVADPPAERAGQRLDHIGFALATPAAVDTWYAHLTAHGVKTRGAPRTHRDGARSFYCEDPDGNAVQLIFHPPLATNQG